MNRGDLILATALTVVGTPTVLRGDLVYVSNEAGVSLVSPDQQRVVAAYGVGRADTLALSADGLTLYVGSAGTDGRFHVTIVSTETSRVVSVIPVAGRVVGLAASSASDELWVAHARHCSVTNNCKGEGGISVIDLTTGEVVTILHDRLDQTFRGVTFANSGRTVYTVNYSQSALVALAPATREVVDEWRSACCIESGPTLHPNGHSVYALGWEFGGFLAVADLELLTDFPGGGLLLGQDLRHSDRQWDIAFSPDGQRAYLPGRDRELRESLFIVDSSDALRPALSDVVELPMQASAIAMSSDGATAYLTSAPHKSLMLFDTTSGRVSATIPLDMTPAGIVVGPDTGAVGFAVEGCVPHATSAGCGFSFGSVRLDPLGFTAPVEAGYFRFEGIPPGRYVLRYSGGCDALGCRPPIQVEVVDQDVFAFFELTSGCPGDCGRDRSVEVDDVARCLALALGGEDATPCRACDVNSDFRVTVDEILLTVNAALEGC